MARHFKESKRGMHRRKEVRKPAHVSDRKVVAEADRMPNRQPNGGRASGRNASGWHVANGHGTAAGARPATRQGMRAVSGYDNSSLLWRGGLVFSSLTYALGVTFCLLGVFGLLHKPSGIPSSSANQTTVTPAVTSADASSESTTAAPAGQADAPVAETVTFDGVGFSVALPASIANNPDVTWDANLPGLKFRDVALAWFDLDPAYWDSSPGHSVHDTRNLQRGTLQLATGDDNTLFGNYAEASGQRITIGTRNFNGETFSIEPDASSACRALQATVSSIDENDDPQRIAEEFLTVLANGIAFEQPKATEPAAEKPDAQPATSAPGAQPVGETFTLGGWRFSVPAYWLGKVDVRYGYVDGNNMAGNAEAYDWANFYAAGTDYVIARIGYARDWNSVRSTPSYNPTRWKLPADWISGDGFIGGSEVGYMANIVLDSGEAFCAFAPSHYFSDSRSQAGGYNKFSDGGLDSDEVYALVKDLQVCGGACDDLTYAGVHYSRGTFIHVIMGSAVREAGEEPAPQEVADSEAKPAESEPVDTETEDPNKADEEDDTDGSADSSGGEVERSGLSSRTSEFYGVWADSAQDHDYCVYALEKAREAGFEAELFITDDWENLSQKTKGWYVVTLICADSKDEADAVLERAREAGYDNAYIKQTGAYVGP